MPTAVMRRATRELMRLEEQKDGLPQLDLFTAEPDEPTAGGSTAGESATDDLNINEDPHNACAPRTHKEVLAALQPLSFDELTPRQALDMLYELQEGLQPRSPALG